MTTKAFKKYIYFSRSSASKNTLKKTWLFNQVTVNTNDINLTKFCLSSMGETRSGEKKVFVYFKKNRLYKITYRLKNYYFNSLITQTMLNNITWQPTHRYPGDTVQEG